MAAGLMFGRSAMLEHTCLVICPTAPDGSRAIADASGTALLGVAMWRRGCGRWWWPEGSILAVHEHDDTPLVFTVQRRWNWPPRREVRDADGNRVGELIGDWVRDEFGRHIAVRKRHVDQTLLIDRAGKALATYRPDSAGRNITFSPEVAGDPFVKMLLLAAVLLDTA